VVSHYRKWAIPFSSSRSLASRISWPSEIASASSSRVDMLAWPNFEVAGVTLEDVRDFDCKKIGMMVFL
jgi:hypothetical protein